jgi:hypothetical protein
MADHVGLTGPVHPAFAKKRFFVLDGVDYDTVLLQSARLASALIRTPQAVHFFLGTLTTVPHVSALDKDSKSIIGHVYQEPKHIFALQASDRFLVAEALERVAETLTWNVQNIPGYGRTVREKRMPNTGSYYSARSRIDISKSLCQRIAQAQNRDEKLSLQFLLAATMVHELAHATMRTVTGIPDGLRFGPSGVGEAGWEIEARIFGLCPSEVSGTASGELWWHEVGRSQDLGGLNLQRPVERVQIEYIKELFTDSFWQLRLVMQGVSMMIPSAAWPPRVFVPDSVGAIIQHASRSIPRKAIAEVPRRSNKRKRSGDDEKSRDKVIGTEDETAQVE